jgi:crotonyl-CoA carboxylase/reductase
VAAIDLQRVSEVSAEPGELPKTMAAWVIREERFGDPKDAFQVEEIEVPEPGAFEVIVRVMAAGVNYNNVWAALGKPVSVMKYGDHPEFGHHIGGSDASGIVWKVGAGVTRWKVGDEVVVHCNQASYEDPEVHGLDPMAAPSQKIWGYETTWGSFAQFTKVQAQQLLPKPHALTWEEAASYGLVYFTAYRMLITRCQLQAGANVLIWGAAGGLGVFATQLCAAAGANCVGVVSSPEKGELVKRLGAVDYIDRGEFAGMMRKGGESAEEEKARFKVSLGFAKRVKEILGDAPDIVFEHVGKATFPTSVFTAKTFGKIVICAGTTGIDLDFNVAYLWMRQKEILGSHFANAYECTKANELIESGQIRPVLWRTLGFEGVAEAHQLMLENKHLGKISILVGADAEGQGKTAEGPGAIHAEVGA